MPYVRARPASCPPAQRRYKSVSRISEVRCGRCLAVGGLKSSSGNFLVQAAQALPRPTSEQPMKQYACRLNGDDRPLSLAWRDRCVLSLNTRAWPGQSHPAHLQSKQYPLPSSGAAFYSVAAARAVHTFSMRTLPSWHNPGKASTPPVRLDFVLAKIAQQFRSMLGL